jgi:acyl-CoA thioesterase I
MNRRIPLLLLLSLVVHPSSSRAAHEPVTSCPVAEEFATPDEPLEKVAGAIAAGGPVEILAVGTATTTGENNSGGAGSSFPYRMADALHAALPRVTFNLTVSGARGITAEAMLPLINQALAARHYQLVIWQTGTVEAVRGLQPDGMEAALQDGVDRVHEAGGNVVLVDAQFSRFLRANADLDPYETVLQQVASMPGVVLFHRFDLMRQWADDGQIDLERTPKAEREVAMARLSTCLGEALARFVLNGVALGGSALNGATVPAH